MPALNLAIIVRVKVVHGCVLKVFSFDRSYGVANSHSTAGKFTLEDIVGI